MSTIVAVVGTKGPFPRLVEALAVWASRHPQDSVWVQHASGDLPLGLDGAPQIPRAEILAKFAEAQAVVIHAGGGAVIDALRAGHVPVVVPRQAQFGEHVNDHQLEIAQAMGDRIVQCLHPEDPNALEAAIERARGRRGTQQSRRDPLEDELRAHVDALASQRGRRRTQILWNLLAVLTRSVRVERR